MNITFQPGLSREAALAVQRSRSLPLFESDILVPDFRKVAYVCGKEIHAVGGVEVDDLHSQRAQPFDAALKIAAFANDHCAEAKLAHQSAAIPTGREGGNHDEVAVGALAAGIAKRVGFRVQRGISILHAAIVARAEQTAGGVENGGADGNSAFGQALARFSQSLGQHARGV